MLNCADYRDSLALLADGELSEDAAHGVRAHLSTCDDCRAFMSELESLASLLTPAPSAGLTVEESRFWRRFDHDLALKVARGDSPWWKQSIALPFPLAAATLGTMLVLGFVAVRSYERAQIMSLRTAHLEKALKTLSEDSLFGSLPSARTVAENPPIELLSHPVSGGGASRHMNSVQPFEERIGDSLPHPTPNNRTKMEIRLIDSDSDLQPADLY